MSKNVRLEKDLYQPMCRWLREYLEDNYRGYEIIVEDTSSVSLDSVLDHYGVIDEYPEVVGIGIQIDILGIVKERYRTSLFFIEAKKTLLNTHDLGQILVYSRICNPEKAFLFSSAGTGSLGKLIQQREDLTYYSQDKRLKMIQIAKWDVARAMPDVISMIPKSV